MFSVRNDLNNQIVSSDLKTSQTHKVQLPKESKSNLGIKLEKNNETILKVLSLPNGTLLVYTYSFSEKNHLQIYDTYTLQLIKKVYVETIKAIRLLTEKRIVIHRFNEDALILDLNLNFISSMPSTNHLSHLVYFNEEIIIGYESNVANVKLHLRSETSKTEAMLDNFLQAIGHNKMQSLISLGRDKVVALLSNYHLSVVNWNGYAFKQVAFMDFYKANEWIYSIANVNESLFLVSTEDLLKSKNPKIRHLRIYDSQTLECVEDITVPASIPTRKIKPLNDGRTLISWDPLMKPSIFGVIDIKTHNFIEIKIPQGIQNLSILPNNQLMVAQKNSVIRIDINVVKTWKQDTRKKILQQLGSVLPEEKNPSTTHSPKMIIAEYLDDQVTEGFTEKETTSLEILKKEIIHKIKSFKKTNTFWSFFGEDPLIILKLCLRYLEDKSSDDKELQKLLLKFTPKENQQELVSYLKKTYALVKQRNSQRIFSDFHLQRI